MPAAMDPIMTPSRPCRRAVAGAFLLLCGIGAAAADHPPAGVLSTIRAVIAHRQADDEPAATVLLEDVVVLSGDRNNTVYVRDRTGATIVKLAAAPNEPRPRFERGDRLAVRGSLMPGLLVNGVLANAVERLPAGPLPEPRPVTAALLASGEAYLDLVTFACIGRATRRATDGFPELIVAMGDDTFPVRIDPCPEAANLERLVDADLQVIGRAAGEVNDRRQFVSPRVVVDDFGDIEILREAGQPFTAESVPFAALYPVTRDGHRRRISGVAAAGYVGGGLFLSDGVSGLYVAPADTTDDVFKAVRPGDRVEAEGFPAMGVFTAFLADARIRKTGTAALPVPSLLGPSEPGDRFHDAELVTVTIELTGREERAEGTELRGRTDGVAWRCLVGGSAPNAAVPGAQVTVHGVCHVTATTRDRRRTVPAAYDLHAAAADVQIVRAALSWTHRRLVRNLAWTAALLGGLGLMAGVWIISLRGQVRRQLKVIEQALHDDAVVEERQRIAREFHDSLEQDLAGLALRLDAASGCVADTEARRVLDRQRELVARLQEETRMFVWDLRDPRLAASGFCETLAAQLAARGAMTAVPIHFHLGGVPPALPLTVRHHVLRIVGEAVTNALRHAGASSIQVRVSADGRVLTVEDDGRGFELAACLAKPGHFGLRGMQERGRRIGAAVEIDTSHETGTRVTIQLPAGPPGGRRDSPAALA